MVAPGVYRDASAAIRAASRLTDGEFAAAVVALAVLVFVVTFAALVAFA